MAELDREPGDNWERKALEKVALAAVQEQRRARHWSIFFKLLLFIYLFALLFIALGWTGRKDSTSSGKHTAMVELRGVIGPESAASADNIVTGLQEAFKDKRTQGVILRINSPGGSPVQAGHINDEIKRLRGKYPNIPVYAVVEDICASGGYYVAVAADQIYVDKGSIIGSIGVLMDGFGFTGLMEKLGVERRLMTAGENKVFSTRSARRPKSSAPWRSPCSTRCARSSSTSSRRGAASGSRTVPSCSPDCSGAAGRRWKWAWRTSWAI